MVLYGPHEKSGENFQGDQEIQGARAGFSRADSLSGAAELFDALYPPGMQWYWKADFMRTLSDDAIAQYVKYAATTADIAVDDAYLSD